MNATDKTTADTLVVNLTDIVENGLYGCYDDSLDFISDSYGAYSAVLITVSFILLLVGSIVGNTCFIYVVWYIKSMRKVLNWFLINLSVADMLFISIHIPAQLYVIYYKEESYSLGTCVSINFTYLPMYVSMFTVMIISVERYLSLAYPLTFYLNNSRDRATKVCVCTWLAASLFCAPFIVICFYKYNCYDPLHYVVYFAQVIPYDLTAVVMIVAYSLCIRTLKKGLDGKESDSEIAVTPQIYAENKQVIRLLSVTAGTYVLLLLPKQILLLISGPDVVANFLKEPAWTVASHTCLYINCCCNPVVYNCTSASYREAFKTTFGRYIMCKACVKQVDAIDGQIQDFNDKRVKSYVRKQRKEVQSQSGSISGQNRSTGYTTESEIRLEEDELSKENHSEIENDDQTFTEDTKL